MNRNRCGAFVFIDHKIVLIKRTKPDREYYVFPGGGREENETDEQCISREIEEELSLKTKDLKKCLSFYDYEGDFGETYFIVSVELGKINLSGPEKEKNTKENNYQIVLLDPISALSLDNLYPPIARVWIQDYLKVHGQSVL